MFTKSKIINFIRDKQLPDGGFFFAKIEPSCGADTFYAVESLRFLGVKPDNVTGVKKYWQTEMKSGNIADITGVFFYTKVHRILNYPLIAEVQLKKIVQNALFGNRYFRRRHFESVVPTTDLFDTSANTFYVDVCEGELRELYYLNELCDDYKIQDKQNKIIHFAKLLENTDGGFGKIGGSQPATTYYALQILLKNKCMVSTDKIATFVNSCIGDTYYLEDLFWLLSSLKLLHLELPEKKSILKFLDDCSRSDGGFSRSRNLGVSTLEYTYFAVNLLKCIEEV